MHDHGNYIKYKFVNQPDITRFAIIPISKRTFESDNGCSFCAITCGGNISLSLFNIGDKKEFENFSKFASFVKDRISQTLTVTIGTVLFTLLGGVITPEIKQEDENIAITSKLDFRDDRRIVHTVVVSNNKRLFATTDNLGRVMLFDSRSFVSVRLWKGVRDAQVVFCQGRVEDCPPAVRGTETGVSAQSTFVTPAHTVTCLAIHAPRTGLVSVWKLIRGGCLWNIAVGNGACHLVNLPGNNSNSR